MAAMLYTLCYIMEAYCYIHTLAMLYTLCYTMEVYCYIHIHLLCYVKIQCYVIYIVFYYEDLLLHTLAYFFSFSIHIFS